MSNASRPVPLPRALRAGLACILGLAGCFGGGGREEKWAEETNERLTYLNAFRKTAEERLDALDERVSALTSDILSLQTLVGGLEGDLRKIRERLPALREIETDNERKGRLGKVLQRFETQDPGEWLEVKEQLVRLGRDALPPLLERYRAGDPVALLRVPEVLREVVDPDAMPVLADALQHVELRRLVAEALGTLRNPLAAPFLAPHLADKDPAVRHAVAVALGKLGHLHGVPILLAELDSAEDRTRLLALDALEKITGQVFGYRAFDPDAVRRGEALGRWKAWWETQAKSLAPLPVAAGGAPSGPPPEPPAGGPGEPPADGNAGGGDK